MPRGAPPGTRYGGRQKGTPNKINAKTRDELWAEIDRRCKAGQQANPFLVGLDLLCETQDERLRLQAAEFVGERLLPKLKAVEYTQTEPAAPILTREERLARIAHLQREVERQGGIVPGALVTGEDGHPSVAEA